MYSLLKGLLALPVKGKNVTALFVRRLRTSGWRSAMAFARCTLVNAYLRRRNRMTCKPKVQCPCCGWEGHGFLMLDCGDFTVPGVECPACHGHERHRMLYLYLDRHHPEFFSMSGKVLHFAPEKHIRDLILRNPDLHCISTDYAAEAIGFVPGPKVQTDMQRMALADDAVDVLFCLHVLEHVPDDRKGLAELHRILKPSGTAYIMVPFMMGWDETVEFGAPDPAIFDHVRGYSPKDFRERLAPLEYEEITPESFLTTDEIRRYRIPDSQTIYRCFKRSPE